MILVPYNEALGRIKEADVLLFRGEGLMSWMIKRYGGGTHSHAGNIILIMVKTVLLNESQTR